jgi:hypothetical protein
VQGPWLRHTRFCGGGCQPDPLGAWKAWVFARRKLVSPHRSFDVNDNMPISGKSGRLRMVRNKTVPLLSYTATHYRAPENQRGSESLLFSRVAFAWLKLTLPSDWSEIYGSIVSRSFPHPNHETLSRLRFQPSVHMVERFTETSFPINPGGKRPPSCQPWRMITIV